MINNINNIPKSEEERFSDTAIQLSKAIYHNVKNLFSMGYKTIDPNIVLMASNVIGHFNKHSLIQGFISNSHIQCWKKIKERDEKFFVENASDIFKYLPSGEVNLFKDLFTTTDKNGKDVINQDTKDQIWKLFDALIKISIKYIHKHRSPVLKNSVDKIYERNFFDEVNILIHSIEWGVKLDFYPII